MWGHEHELVELDAEYVRRGDILMESIAYQGGNHIREQGIVTAVESGGVQTWITWRSPYGDEYTDSWEFDGKLLVLR